MSKNKKSMKTAVRIAVEIGSGLTLGFLMGPAVAAYAGIAKLLSFTGVSALCGLASEAAGDYAEKKIEKIEDDFHKNVEKAKRKAEMSNGNENEG